MSERNDDIRWAAVRDSFGWELPELGSPWTRWPVVRNFRAFVTAWRVEQHYSMGLGMLDLQYRVSPDWVVYAIARGWC